MRILIEEEPPRTTHQSGTKIGPRGTYKSANLKKAEQYFRKHLKDYVPDEPLTGPIKLATTWKYKTKTKKQDMTWKETKPDTDNLPKTLKDIMTELGFWGDDAIVTYETIKKIWSTSPGLEIEIETLEERMES